MVFFFYDSNACFLWLLVESDSYLYLYCQNVLQLSTVPLGQRKKALYAILGMNKTTKTQSI